MTSEPVDLRSMTDAELESYSDYWMQQLELQPTTLPQYALREAAYQTLKDIRREAKRRALKAGQRA